MRKIVLTLMASLLSQSVAFAFWPEATDSALEFGVGYRRDKIEWKTRACVESDCCAADCADCGYYADISPCTDINPCYECDECAVSPREIGSKLKWDNIDIWQIEGRGKYITCDNIYLRFNADYGWITSGKNRDSDFDSIFCDDYYGYNPEYSRTHSKVRGHVYDVRLAVGYQFKLCDEAFSITPLIGYSWHGQHLKDRHLSDNYFSDCCDDTLCTDILDDEVLLATRRKSCYDCYCSDSCAFQECDVEYCGEECDDSCRTHAKYNTRWNGPFIGFDMDYRFGCFCEWELFGTYEFHWAQYHGKGDWRLRPDLPGGFNHHAKNAYGSVFDIGIKWDFCECWTLALKGEFQWWWADKGHDRSKGLPDTCGDISQVLVTKQPLRDVKWQSAAISVNVGMVF